MFLILIATGSGVCSKIRGWEKVLRLCLDLLNFIFDTTTVFSPNQQFCNDLLEFDHNYSFLSCGSFNLKQVLVVSCLCGSGVMSLDVST